LIPLSTGNGRATRVIACLLGLALNNAHADEPFRSLAPQGTTPHPAVLLVPGCSGFTAANGINHYEDRAADLQSAGYVVVFVDYLKKRMQTNCAHIFFNEVADDILQAATWARQQSSIDGSRIAVIGWSYGGGGVLAALKTMPAGPPIAKAVMYYPVCRGAAPWRAAVAGLMLLGAKDDIADPTLCKPVTAGVPNDRLRVITYPGAHHGFDTRGLPEQANHSGAPIYDPQAAKASWAEVMDFLSSPGQP